MLSLDWDIVWTIINLIILYLLMKKFLFGPVMDIMDKRQAMIKDQFLNASQTKEKANDLKHRYETALVSVKDESVKIVEQARTDAKTEYARIVGNASQEAGKLLEAARAHVEMEREKALKEIESQIGELAMTAAERLLAGNNGNQIYDQFLEEAGEANDPECI